MSKKPLTKGTLIRHVASITQLSARCDRELAEGMWNPEFAASEGSSWAKTYCQDLRQRLEWLEDLIDKEQDETLPTAADVRRSDRESLGRPATERKARATSLVRESAPT